MFSDWKQCKNDVAMSSANYLKTKCPIQIMIELSGKSFVFEIWNETYFGKMNINLPISNFSCDKNIEICKSCPLVGEKYQPDHIT